MTTIKPPDDRRLALGLLGIALVVVALFVLMAVTAQVLSPGDSFPITAQLNPL